MHRFYIAPHTWRPDRLTLDGPEAHHAEHVLRMKAGDRLTVFNGLGVEALAEIAAFTKQGAELKTIQSHSTPPLPCAITLAQAVPKGKNMDLIVEKATELGAVEVAPLLSERTVVQTSAADGDRKSMKWQRVAIEAAKQCGQNWLPKVAQPKTPKDFFSSAGPFDLMLIASLQPGALAIKRVLGELTVRPSRVMIMVGPEGDFTPAEISLAISSGCRPVTLGPII